MTFLLIWPQLIFSGVPTHRLIRRDQESAVSSKSQPGYELTASFKNKDETDSKHIQNIINSPIVSIITGPNSAAPAYGPAYAPAYRPDNSPCSGSGNMYSSNEM